MPRPAARPSLLTPNQQADLERNRILSNLEGGKIAAVEPSPRTGTRLWAGLGLGALALVAAGAAWFAGGDSAADEMAKPAVAAPLAAKAAQPMLAPLPAAPATAAIHDDAVAASTAASPQKQESLHAMLNAPAASAAPAPKTGADVLSKALESSSAPKAAAGTSDEAASKVAQARIERKHAAAQAKAKAHARAEARAQQKAQARALAKAQEKAPAKVQATAKADARPKRRSEPDSDVLLLQALVAHAQKHPESKGKPSVEAQLKQCAQGGKSGEDACRARVCGGRGATEGACKAGAGKTVSMP